MPILFKAREKYPFMKVMAAALDLLLIAAVSFMLVHTAVVNYDRFAGKYFATHKVRQNYARTGP